MHFVAVSHAAKLAVMTAPRTAPGSGPVVVQTHSGGVGVSWINFTFVEASESMADSPLQGRRRNKNGGNESLPVTSQCIIPLTCLAQILLKQHSRLS